MSTAPEQPENPSTAVGGSFASIFRTTNWSAVRLAKTGHGAAGAEGMEHLARTYWYPLYAFGCRQGLKESDAEDVTQGFLARFVGGSYLESVDPSRGRFRSFLLVCFKNYLADEREKAAAQKRGCGVEFVPIDAPGVDEQASGAAASLTAEEQYDLDWAHSLFAEMLGRLKLEYEKSRKLDRFEALLPFLMEDPSEQQQAVISKRFSLGDSGFRSALQRLRQRFGEYLWTEIAKTVSGVSEVEQESRHLLGILSKSDPLRALRR